MTDVRLDVYAPIKNRYSPAPSGKLAELAERRPDVYSIKHDFIGSGTTEARRSEGRNLGFFAGLSA